MRTLTSGTLTVQAYDSAVWKQERNILHVTDPDATRCSIYSPTTSDLLATYTLDDNHAADIDLSDYIRTHDVTSWAHQRNVYVATSAEKRVNASYVVEGLINPANLIIPFDDTLARILEYDKQELDIMQGILLVIPPYHMLAGLNGLGISFEFGEINQIIAQDYGLYLEALVSGVWQDIHIDARRSILPANAEAYRLYSDYYDGYFFSRDLQALDCGKTYAAVRWVSATGITRVHTWEIRDVNQASDEVIKLETLDGSYNQIKSRTDGLKLYLDELTAYDYWYYADVINSSKVEVSLDGQTWNQVEVITKSVTIPNTDQGALNKLEIAINWRNYDAVTM